VRLWLTVVPAGSVSVQGGAGFEQAVNKMLMAWLETLSGPARPGRPTLPGGHGTPVHVADGRRIHFWLHPCPFFLDLISFFCVFGKKLVPRGRIPGRESSGIRWKIRLENVLGRGLLGGKVAKTAPEIAEMRENARAGALNLPVLLKWVKSGTPAQGGFPKGKKYFWATHLKNEFCRVKTIFLPRGTVFMGKIYF